MNSDEYFPYLIVIGVSLSFVLLNGLFIEEEELAYTCMAKQFILLVLLFGSMTLFSQEKVPQIKAQVSVKKYSDTIIPGPPKFSPF